MRTKKVVEARNAEARRVVEEEILPEVRHIPPAALDRVATFLQEKISVYQQAMKPINGNGKA